MEDKKTEDKAKQMGHLTTLDLSIFTVFLFPSIISLLLYPRDSHQCGP